MARWLMAALLGTALIGPAHARDYGVHGQLFGIVEPSLLNIIKARIGTMMENGEWDDIKTGMQDRTKAYIKRPYPVLGLMPVETYREFTVDLSITLQQDIADHRGQVFATRGTIVNPLDYSTFSKRIVFFDGDDPAQVDYALSLGNELDTLLVITNGAPLELTRVHGRRFYFDQGGHMVEGFGVTRVPSVVSRADPVMLVQEIHVGQGAK